jgi:bifunctional UDP-N-acetylglucosamine pyrophosphorylase / glucosamine-1-phosphate N-acetyltransferase
VSLGAVILAAGQGTRMRSARPKVLHRIAGRPMIDWVLAAVRDAGAERVVVVVSPDAEGVRAELPAGVEAAVQAEQRGTGDATAAGLAALDRGCDRVLVLYGDTPLVEGALVRALAEEHLASGHAATLVTARLDDPAAYGRVVRAADGTVRGVVEARDASPEELALTEINAGLYAFGREALARALENVGSDNAQGEVYLPDALPLLGGPVGAILAGDHRIVLGVNTREELAACEAIIQERLRRELMLSGVTMPDPSGVYVDARVRVGADTVLWPGTFLRGETEVGPGCEIGPNVVATDTRIGEGSVVVSAHMTESDVGPRCQVGPFAVLRPGTRLEEGAKAGTYVEMKNAVIGPGAKVPHLSYMGDVTVGEKANIGAGNITANYDGFRKHRTSIGARVKTGSDCVFVAPVTVGDDAMTGAGSIITDSVPAGALGIARERQRNIEGFTERAAAKARERSGEAATGEPT